MTPRSARNKALPKIHLPPPPRPIVSPPPPVPALSGPARAPPAGIRLSQHPRVPPPGVLGCPPRGFLGCPPPHRGKGVMQSSGAGTEMGGAPSGGGGVSPPPPHTHLRVTPSCPPHPEPLVAPSPPPRASVSPVRSLFPAGGMSMGPPRAQPHRLVPPPPPRLHPAPPPLPAPPNPQILGGVRSRGGGGWDTPQDISPPHTHPRGG